GNGDGTFEQQPHFGIGDSSENIASADLNGDGHPDVFTSNVESGDVSVLLGNGDGSFQQERRFATNFHFADTRVGAVDVNRDGRPDLVVYSPGFDQAAELLGNGDGSFQNAQPSSATVSYSIKVEVDLNSDGRPDLVDADPNRNEVSVRLSDGDGTFFPFAFGRTVDLRHTPFRVDLNQ